MRGYRQQVDEIYEALLPICNDNYSKDVFTAEEMMRTKQGNCFTLAEMACRQLLEIPQTAGAGIVIEAARRNSHAYCIAMTEAVPAVAILDMVDSKPRFPHITRRTRLAIRAQLLDEAGVLYRSVVTGTNVPVLNTARISDDYEWPEFSTRQRVYIPGMSGIAAAIALAQSGAMRSNLQRSELPPEQRHLVPEIPRR